MWFKLKTSGTFQQRRRMNSQQQTSLPIPIIHEIILFSEPLEQLKFSETCKLFKEFVDSNIFPILTTTLCGSGKEKGFADGFGIYAKLDGPNFGCLNSSSTTLYFTDGTNEAIRMVDLKTNEVKTLCGTPKKRGYKDGEADQVQFNFPLGISLDDAKKLLYVSDQGNHLIRRVRLEDGTTDTLCGKVGERGKDDGVGAEATFFYPEGLCFDSISQYLYVADSANHSIRRVSVNDGRVETICGKYGYLDGSFRESKFDSPTDVAWNSSTEELYVCDRGNQVIRVVSMKEKRVRTLCGTVGVEGYEDGTHNQSKFFGPVGISLDSLSNYLYVCDSGNEVLRRVSLSGEVRVSTVCGSPQEFGMRDGLHPLFFYLRGVVVDQHSHSLYLMDSMNDRVRRVVDRTRLLKESTKLK